MSSSTNAKPYIKSKPTASESISDTADSPFTHNPTDSSSSASLHTNPFTDSKTPARNTRSSSKRRLEESESMPPPSVNEGIDISVLVYHPEIDLKYLKGNEVQGLLWTSLTIRPELKTPNLLAKINDIPDHAVQKVYHDAFAVLEDELLDKTGAFRMSPTMERVLPVTKLRDIVNKREFGGILIVTKGPYILGTFPRSFLMFNRAQRSF